MSTERENLSQSMKIAEYDIQGNRLRAYTTSDAQLVFVLDLTIDDIKPNVLLVINPDDNRKWDDILANDYDIDLETVRPKKDNKYQKLDIEYSGLDKYDRLIRDHVAGADISAAIADLDAFRISVARRVAQERLDVAEKLADQARETIEKTNLSIGQLGQKLKQWRAKLTEYRGQVGRVPGKQIASKILRAESQIDATNEKLARAKKRLVSAQHRLVNAEDDAEIAREILEKLDGTGDVKPVIEYASQQIEITNQTGAKKMAEDDVKPLLDKDPDILDEEIAFKPIVFGAPSTPAVESPVAPVVDAPADDVVFAPAPVVEPVSVPAPVVEQMPVPVAEPVAVPVIEEKPVDEVMFAPAPMVEPVAVPVQEEPAVVQPDVPVVATDVVTAPVLDSLTAVNSGDNQIDAELLGGYAPDASLQSVAMPQQIPVQPVPESVPAVSSVPPAPVVTAPAPVPVVENAPAPVAERPMSPVAERPMSPTADVSAGGMAPRKPTTIYYLLLIVLIVLSIFTLWLYQKSSNKTLPELAVVAEAKTTDDTAEDAESPFIGAKEDVDMVDDKEPAPVEIKQVQPEPIQPSPVVPVEDVVIADVEPESVDVTPAEPVAIAPDVELSSVIPTPVEPEPVVPEQEMDEGSPFLTDEAVAPAKQKSIAEIIANKPVYNVATDDKKFVAAPEFDTGAEEDVDTVTADAAVVEATEPTIVRVEDAVSSNIPEVVASDVVVEEVVQETCADGAMPDEDGCCAGEELTDVGGGEMACCAVGTDECFPPMI